MFVCFLAVSQVLLFAKEDKTQAQKSLERRQRVELLGFFLKDPEQAVLPSTNVAIEFYNEGVTFYEKKEYEPALLAFETSLKHNPNNALAYELMGDIYYYQQKISQADNHYRRAYELSPRDGLRKKIEKIESEKTVEKKFSTYTEEHFIIKYKRDDSRYEGSELKEMLKDTYRLISESFGFYLQHQVVVLLYDQQEFAQLTALPHWAAGVYDGKVRMPAYSTGFSDQMLKALSVHEVTHAFISVIAKGRAPAWINEGLAEYHEAKVTPPSTIVFKAAIKTNTLFTLDELTGSAGPLKIEDALRVNLFYEQSHQLIEYLVKRYGMFLVKKILEAYAEGKSSNEAIRDVLKISIQRLEREWKEAL